MSRRPRLGDYFENRQESGCEGLPMLSVTMHDGIVHRDELDRRTESALRPDQHLLVRRGDIAYNMMRMWQGACGLSDIDGLVSPAYVVLAPKKNIDSRFAYHWFKSDRMTYLFWAYSHGLTEDRLRLYFDDFAEIPITPPSLEQQRRIVSVLDAWDRATDWTEQLVAAKRRRWQLSISEMSKTQWAPTALGKLGKWVGGGTPSKDNIGYWVNGTIPWVSPKDMGAWKVSSTEDFITETAISESSTRLVPRGSILIVTRSGILRTKVPVAITTRPVAINQDLKALLLNEPKLGPLVTALLISASERLRQATMKTGTTVESIDLDGLKAFHLNIPSSEQFESASVVIVGGLTEIELLEARLDRIRAQKRGLMRKLLAGESHLNERFDRELTPALNSTTTSKAAI